MPVDALARALLAVLFVSVRLSLPMIARLVVLLVAVVPHRWTCGASTGES